MRKKIVNSLITATVIGSMLTGMAVPCFAGGKKDGGNSITVLVESGSPAEALANNTAADFEKETGCKVVVDAVAYTVCMISFLPKLKQDRLLMMLHVWILYGWQLLLMQSNQLQMQIPVICFQRWKKVEQ